MTNPASLIALADQCVKCGLCLPQCPTYTLNLNENESPRGRISLIQAVAAEQLKPSTMLLSHLDHCLQCRRCERVCPSQVQYGKLIQQARNELALLKPATSFMGQLGLWFIEKPQRLGLLQKLLRVYQHTGLQWLARNSGLLTLLRFNKLEQRLPKISKAHKAIKIQKTGKKKPVAIYTGCTQPLFDAKVISSAYKLLTRLGYDVDIPQNQLCCGALHTTQGRQDKSRQLLKQNADVFSPDNFEKVLYLSSGCGAFISEQTRHANAFAHFKEITEFLVQHSELTKLKFKPLKTKLAVHLPCSQKNILKQGNTAIDLLQLIPQVSLLNLEQSGCCGAGGTTMISYPQIADNIRQPLLQTIAQAGCSTVVSTNPGCQLHMQNGFTQQQQKIDVVHPVTLLAQQLEA